MKFTLTFAVISISPTANVSLGADSSMAIDDFMAYILGCGKYACELSVIIHALPTFCPKIPLYQFVILLLIFLYHMHQQLNINLKESCKINLKLKTL